MRIEMQILKRIRLAFLMGVGFFFSHSVIELAMGIEGEYSHRALLSVIFGTLSAILTLNP